jgi:hypothetical protein
VCALAAAWLGCDIAVDEGAIPDDPLVDPPAAPGALVLSFHGSDGQDAPGGAFAAKDEVFLRARLAPRDSSFASGDFAFEMFDATGRMVSGDALDCRRFHIATDVGGIADVRAGFSLEGAPCGHRWGVHGDGTLLVQLIPFADAPPNSDGVAEYTVRIARVEQIAGGVFPADALAAAFLLRAP